MRLRDIPITAWIGMAGIVIAFIFAIFAPWIAPYGETQVVGDVWQMPDDQYIFGLDNLGRDIFSRLIYGARTTLVVASAATVISFSLGIILSFTAAVSRGVVDTVLSRFNDLMMSIPTLIFALVVLAVLPQNIVVLILVMAILDSTRVYRLGRAVALDVAVMEFVEAATLRGIQPPAADWGGMVKDNKDGIIFGISAALVPGTAIATLAVCVNLVVDWLLKRTSSLKGGRGDA
jgi:peptide/nickel transport system permease protein